jgi:predicted Holliday junction resolvase-like endonuclease
MFSLVLYILSCSVYSLLLCMRKNSLKIPKHNRESPIEERTYRTRETIQNKREHTEQERTYRTRENIQNKREHTEQERIYRTRENIHKLFLRMRKYMTDYKRNWHVVWRC